MKKIITAHVLGVRCGRPMPVEDGAALGDLGVKDGEVLGVALGVMLGSKDGAVLGKSLGTEDGAALGDTLGRASSSVA